MTQKVCFAIPTITGDIRCETAKNLIEAVLLCQAAGIETDLRIIANCPVLPVARNSLVALFMSDPEATDLFFLDYDVGFDPIAVVKLLQRPEEIIAGAYRVKVDDREEYSVVIKTNNGSPIGKVISQDPPLAIVEAEFLAAGFMRIKREVFTRMAESYPNLKYKENVVRTTNEKITEAYDFFGMGIDDTRGRYTTEDYMFCKRWRDIGGSLWIYPDVDFDHIGRKAYSGNFHKHLMNLPGGKNSNIHKATLVDGWMSIPELTWLGVQAMTHKSIVEIGSFAGRSTRALADNTPGSVTAVDTWLGSAEHKEALAEFDPDALYKVFLENTADLKNLTPIRASSVDGARSLADRKFDLIFIDASHDYDNVKADVEAWLPLLEEDGVICGHDASYPGVTKALQELLPSYQVAPGTDIWFWRR